MRSRRLERPAGQRYMECYKIREKREERREKVIHVR